MLDTSKSDGKNEGRSGRFNSILVCELELLGIVWDEHAQEEDRQTVEEQNPVEGELDGARNRLARILGFTDSHTDQLSTKVGEDGIDQRRPETIESARVTLGDVFPESPGLVVVLKASCVSWTGADGEKEGQNNNTDLTISLAAHCKARKTGITYNCDDFYSTKPKLKFTEELDAEIVDADDDNEEDCHPHTRIDSISRYSWPFLDNQCRRCELIRRCDDVFAPICPAKRKSKSGVAEAGSITSKTRRVRDPGSHFTKSSHDDVDQETN
jgi:hypothetical protein